MELKLWYFSVVPYTFYFLPIVPNGIEIIYTEDEREKLWLPIVPNGIEIQKEAQENNQHGLLPIVPNGIEIANRDKADEESRNSQSYLMELKYWYV